MTGWLAGRRSLYWRTIAILSVVMGLAAAALAVAARYHARRAADDAYDRLLIGAALQMAESLSVHEGVVWVDPPSSAFETLALAPRDSIFYKITDAGGTVLTGYADLPAIRGRPAPVRASPVVGDGRYLDMPIRLAAVGRFLTDAAEPGWAQVLVGQTRRARTALAQDLAGKALWLLAAMMALAFLGVLLAVRLALAPLRAIERTLQGRDPRDLAPLEVETPQEIATLVGAINFFMDRLSRRIRLMERFIADAAHQIRTPLTALASQVDMLANADEAHRAQHERRVRERTAQLGRLTNQLLNHAMVIHRAEAAPLAPVDLSRLAREVLLNAVPASFGRDVAIGWEAPPGPVLVRGDEVSLREALSNLLHNALAHGARSALEIELSVEGAEALVAVADDGPGIPEAGWEKAKQPFSSQSEKGSGLGLAIVNDVVRAHGGSLDFERRPPGFAVVIRLPLAEPEAGSEARPA